MAIPSVEQVMLPVLQALAAGPRASAEIAEDVATRFGLSDSDRQTMIPGSGQRLWRNRVAWALVWGGKAGLMEKPEPGLYVLTNAGRAALENPPAVMTAAYLRRYPGFKNYRGGTNSDDLAQEPATSAAEVAMPSPTERIGAAVAAHQQELATELLARVRQLDPTAFEDLIVALMVAMGYGGSRDDAAQRLGGTGDGGVDGVIREDALGLDAIYLQAKRYAEDNIVGPGAIQAFAGALLGKGASKGVFVTTSRFTSQARGVADGLRSSPRIVLVDGPELARLMMQHEIGVRTIDTVRIQRLDLESFEPIAT